MGGRTKTQTPPTVSPPPLRTPAPPRCSEEPAPRHARVPADLATAPGAQLNAACREGGPAAPALRRPCAPPPLGRCGTANPGPEVAGRVRSPPGRRCQVLTPPFPKRSLPTRGPVPQRRGTLPLLLALLSRAVLLRNAQAAMFKRQCAGGCAGGLETDVFVDVRARMPAVSWAWTSPLQGS